MGSVSSTSAPYAFRSARRRGLAFSGMTSLHGTPSGAESIAYAIPVLPLVASRSPRPRGSRPRAIASRRMKSAARSFTLPPGLRDSSFASTRTPRARSGLRRSISTSGVSPTRRQSAGSGSVSRDTRVDLLGPRADAAGQVARASEAEAAQELHDARGADARVAVDDDVAVERERVRALG